jgi:hypothetical protein
VSAQPINDLELIEHLDFEHTPQCEHSEHHEDTAHYGPAYVLVRAACPVCPFGPTLYLCEGFWSWVCNTRRTLKCNGCGHCSPAQSFYAPLGWVE